MRVLGKHGMCGTPTYKSWDSMKQRCNNPNDPTYHRYGAKGIKVCDRWQGQYGFNNFLEDLGERPKDKSLDRIDPDKGYEPGNCQWATIREQAWNKKKKNPSGHIGVHIRGKKFRAQISVKNKKINLGTFNTAEEARAAYLAAIPDQEYQYVK